MKASIEAILVTLFATLKIIISVEIKFWKTPFRIISQNLSFQGKCLWWSSVLAKALSLQFAVILLIILKLIILQNFTQAYSEPSRTSKMEDLAKTAKSRKKTKSSIFAKSSVLDFRLGSEYASAFFYDSMNSNL